MKTIKLHVIPVFIATILVFSVIPTFASDIPREVVPDNTPQAAVDIAESYISDTLWAAKSMKKSGYMLTAGLQAQRSLKSLAKKQRLPCKEALLQ